MFPLVRSQTNFLMSKIWKEVAWERKKAVAIGRSFLRILHGCITHPLERSISPCWWCRVSLLAQLNGWQDRLLSHTPPMPLSLSHKQLDLWHFCYFNCTWGVLVSTVLNCCKNWMRSFVKSHYILLHKYCWGQEKKHLVLSIAILTSDPMLPVEWNEVQVPRPFGVLGIFQ